MIRRITPFLVSVALVSMCLFLFGIQLDDFYLRVISKPIPVLIMVLVVMMWGRGSYARVVATGLVMCAIGDVLLEFRGYTSMFIAGMIAFLVGHLCYVTAFIRRSSKPNVLEALPFAAWIGWVILTVWGGMAEMMRIPVVFYALAIFAMMWRATAMVSSQEHRRPLDWFVVVGAVIFAFSDTLIALDRFHSSIEGVRTPIILTYWIGQSLISASTLSRSISAPSPIDDNPIWRGWNAPKPPAGS